MPEYTLLWGPQDCAKIRQDGGFTPGVIFVDPKRLGDGYAVWSREPCDRFSARYEWAADEFKFVYRP